MDIASPAAVLFDFDGTLVDTEPYWTRGRVDMLHDLGVPYSLEQSEQLRGASREDSQAALMRQLELNGFDTSTIDDDEFYEDLCQRVVEQIETLGAPWLPGVPALLADLKEKGVPCAVVSASPESVLLAGLKEFPPDVISIVVDGTMVNQSKPDPESYLMAADLLGVRPEDCVVIEDTVAGAASGRGAGAVVIAVPDMYDVPDAPHQVKVQTLEGVDAARLVELYRQGLDT